MLLCACVARRRDRCSRSKRTPKYRRTLTNTIPTQTGTQRCSTRVRRVRERVLSLRWGPSGHIGLETDSKCGMADVGVGILHFFFMRPMNVAKKPICGGGLEEFWVGGCVGKFTEMSTSKWLGKRQYLIYKAYILRPHHTFNYAYMHI